MEYTFENYVTIPAAADEVYTLIFAQGHKIDIMNGTDGCLMISEKDSFSSEGTQKYLTLDAGSCYNGLEPRTDRLYIKAEGSGNICAALRR